MEGLVLPGGSIARLTYPPLWWPFNSFEFQIYRNPHQNSGSEQNNSLFNYLHVMTTF